MRLIFYIIVALALLGALAALASWLHNRHQERLVERGELEAVDTPKTVDFECCGQHETCEKDSLLAAVSREVEYYNDEELDRFRGREGDAYTEEECEEFRDVLYTMKTDEVAGWVRSLQLRYINLPDDLKDEVFLIVGENRATR